MFLLLSCTKRNTGNVSSGGYSYPGVSRLPEKRINDLAYGTHPLQALDLLLPSGRSRSETKIMVLVHGGQWVAGDKSDMEGYISVLKSKLPDFAFATINYRLIDGSGILIQDPEQDIANALSFLWAKSNSLGISDKTVLLGESAGGQLALLNAYKLSSSRIKAAIGLKSPSHLVNWYNRAAHPQIKPLLESITGGTPLSKEQVYFDASPINFVNAGDPATLLIHGDSDGFVLTEQATELSAKLVNSGVVQQLILVPQETHTFSLDAQLQVYDYIAIFLSDRILFK